MFHEIKGGFRQVLSMLSIYATSLMFGLHGTHFRSRRPKPRYPLRTGASKMRLTIWYAM